MKSSVIAGAVGLVSAVAFAAPAFAASGSFADGLGPSSAKFNNGQWSFERPRADNSAFLYSGNLKDNDSDGDWVYTRGKIDGYGWAGGASAENHGGYPSVKYVSQQVSAFDPAQQGKIQVCRHRDGVIPNDCEESGWKYR